MNEISVVVNQTPGVIECNFDEIKEALARQMTAYTSLEVTEENIPESKKDLATLRKIRKAVDDRRKEIKKDFSKPYDEFEKRVKDILSVIDEPIGMIDSKLKEFEEKRVAERQAHLLKLYEDNIGEYAPFLTFEALKTPQWDNKTCTDATILSDISTARLAVRQDLDSIHALESEIEDKLIEAYRLSGNSLNAAISKNTQYIEAKRLAEKRVEEEQAKKEVHAAKEAQIVIEEPEKPETAEQPVEEYVTFIVSASDAEQVAEILSFNDIEYRRA